MSELNAQAQAAGSAAKEKLKQSLNNMEKQRQAAVADLDKLKHASAKAWRSVHAEMRDAMQALKNAYEDASRKLKEG